MPAADGRRRRYRPARVGGVPKVEEKLVNPAEFSTGKEEPFLTLGFLCLARAQDQHEHEVGEDDNDIEDVDTSVEHGRVGEGLQPRERAAERRGRDTQPCRVGTASESSSESKR